MASAVVRGVFVVFPGGGGRCVVTTCRLEKIKLYGMLMPEKETESGWANGTAVIFGIVPSFL